MLSDFSVSHAITSFCLFQAYYAELGGRWVATAAACMQVHNSRFARRVITRPQRIPATVAESTEKTNKIMEGVVQGCARCGDVAGMKVQQYKVAIVGGFGHQHAVEAVC